MPKAPGFSTRKATSLDYALAQNADRIAQYQVPQRNFDTRDGNMVLRDETTKPRILLGYQKDGF